MNRPEFDNYASSYEELLKDPVRDRFGGSPDFFHLRKRDLIRSYFRHRNLKTDSMRYLDVGCGKGELLALLSENFASVAGCDPSAGMLSGANNFEMRVQSNVRRIPYDSNGFDFVTAVCVYHHVPVAERTALSCEIGRVMKTGGVLVIIEHNPYNPITRLVVGRTPVDSNAILLTRSETSRILESAGFSVVEWRYFLYFPEFIYRSTGDGLEKGLGWLALGGQYAVFATKNDASTS
ncbi:MAG TPA: class I SAM-dependent methyltransferase [Terriglobales bacterium]|nr:class I SAM-dependent methyltransferase [Terriglobales bacterium]